MSIDLALTITGIQELQKANAEMMRAISPRGGLGKAIKEGTQQAHRYAQIITHVDTGSWKASHRMDFREADTSARGQVYIDPYAVNPQSNIRPAVYASGWEEWGGEMAVYERTVNERGERIIRDMIDIIQRAMPK